MKKHRIDDADFYGGVFLICWALKAFVPAMFACFCFFVCFTECFTKNPFKKKGE